MVTGSKPSLTISPAMPYLSNDLKNFAWYMVDTF